MTLAAAQVIDTLAALLVPMVTTGGRVFTSRAWPIGDGEFPAWRVTAEDEVVEPATLGGANQHRLVVVAKAYARAVNDLDDVLHGLAEVGLGLLFASGPLYDLQLEGIERDMPDDAEAACGTVTLRLRALYFVDPAIPGTIL